jgi:hypothetical protein
MAQKNMAKRKKEKEKKKTRRRTNIFPETKGKEPDITNSQETTGDAN